MDLNKYFEYGLIAIVAIVIIVAAVRFIKKKSEDIHSSEDLIQYLESILRDKIVPYILKEALKEDLNGALDYISFRDIIKNKFVDKIYDAITDPKVVDGFNIPDTLLGFVTKENLKKVVDEAFKLDEVDSFMQDLYAKLCVKSMESMTALEEETTKKNAELGVEDEDDIVREKLGIVHSNEESVDISAEIFDSVKESDLVSDSVDE